MRLAMRDATDLSVAAGQSCNPRPSSYNALLHRSVWPCERKVGAEKRALQWVEPGRLGPCC
jgi:hypothetical protein